MSNVFVFRVVWWQNESMMAMAFGAGLIVGVVLGAFAALWLALRAVRLPW